MCSWFEGYKPVNTIRTENAEGYQSTENESEGHGRCGRINHHVESIPERDV